MPLKFIGLHLSFTLCIATCVFNVKLYTQWFHEHIKMHAYLETINNITLIAKASNALESQNINHETIHVSFRDYIIFLTQRYLHQKWKVL